MKSLLFLPLLLLTVFFTSCKKETINQVVPNRTIITTVNPGDWQRDDAKKTWYATINMPEIDERVYETNGVLVYISFDGKVYEAIPDVLDGSTLEVTHSVGYLYIDIQGADGTQVNPPGAAIKVKIVIIESDPA